MERKTIDARGEVSVLDYRGDGPLIVCVHGLEGSAFNWNLIGPELARDHRVVAPDLSGFGYTPPLDRGASVEANAELVADPEFSAWLEKRTPAARWGQVEELVGAAVFLSSAASSFVNGHTLFVDGGITASL